jgi:hypothetical protein
VTLQALLADVHPCWWAGADGDEPQPELLRLARDSRAGRRLLASWLPSECGALLAPAPEREVGAIALKWPRHELAPLLRDVGVLACAPAIRAEVRREPVRQLKALLGSSYLLALDRTIWDGQLEPAHAAVLQLELAEALAAGDARQPRLEALFERRGRGELRAWATRRDPALAAWVAVLHPREPETPAHLPEKAILRVYTHHESRALKR